MTTTIGAVSRREYVALDERGHEIATACRGSWPPLWRISAAIGHRLRVSYALTRGGARRTLHRLATETLTARAILRARLDTYRGDFEDRHTGWRAPR